MKSSSRAASREPATYVLPPTVHGVRGRIVSHSRFTSDSASSGTSILRVWPFASSRKFSRVKNDGVRTTKSRSKPLVGSWIGVGGHVGRLAFVHQLRVGQRAAALPDLRDARVTRGGHRIRPEVGADEHGVDVNPAQLALGLGQLESVLDERLGFDVELARDARIGAAARQRNQAPAIGRPEGTARP